MRDVGKILTLLLRGKRMSDIEKSDASGFILQFILEIPGGHQTIDIHEISEIMNNLRYLKSISPTKGVLFTSIKKSGRPCEIFQPMKGLRIIKNWKASLIREENKWLSRKAKWHKQHGQEAIFPEKPPPLPEIPPLAFTSFRPGTIYFYFSKEAKLNNSFDQPTLAFRRS